MSVINLNAFYELKIFIHTKCIPVKRKIYVYWPSMLAQLKLPANDRLSWIKQSFLLA